MHNIIEKLFRWVILTIGLSAMLSGCISPWESGKITITDYYREHQVYYYVEGDKAGYAMPFIYCPANEDDDPSGGELVCPIWFDSNSAGAVTNALPYASIYRSDIDSMWTEEEGSPFIVYNNLNYQYANYIEGVAVRFNAATAKSWAFQGGANGECTSTAWCMINFAQTNTVKLNFTLVLPDGRESAETLTLTKTGDFSVEVSWPYAGLPNIGPKATGVAVTAPFAESYNTLSGNYLYSDREKDLEGDSIYRWVKLPAEGGKCADGTTVKEGSDNSYEVNYQVDGSHSVCFCVTPVAASGKPTGKEVCSATSPQIFRNDRPEITDPAISGTTRVGSELTGTYSYWDYESDAEGTSTFRWVRNSVDSGAWGVTVGTSLKYRTVSKDLNQYLFFCATPVATTGTATGIERCSAASARIGATIQGTVEPPPYLGASENNSYSVTGADSTNNPIDVTLKVAPLNNAPKPPVESVLGPISIVSDSGGSNGYSIAVVFKLPENSTGTYTGFWKYGPQTNGGTYEWYDFGTLAANGNGTGYVISDGGKTITIHLKDNVRGDLKLDGEDGKIVDPAILVVTNNPPVANGVNIGGLAKVSNQLSGNYTYSDVEADPEGSSLFRWMRNTVSTGITGGTIVATTQNYTAVSADAGNYLYFCVVPIASAGTSAGNEVCSAASAQVEAIGSGSITPPPAGGGTGERVSYSATATDGANNPITASLTVTTTTTPTPAPVGSAVGPISIESDSGGNNGYRLAVVFKLDPSSSSTYGGFWKYGPQTNGGVTEWYDYGTLAANGNGTGYVISDAGKTITIYLTDNVRGDLKLDGADGKINDPGLLVVNNSAVTLQSIPTLSNWGALMLAGLIGMIGFASSRRHLVRR